MTFRTILSLFLMLGCLISLNPAYVHAQKNDLSFSEDDFDDELTFDDEWDNLDAPASGISDPFSGYNQFMFKVNDKVYTYVFNPISKVYDKIFPKVVQHGIDNFFSNAKAPIPFFNNLFQGKVKRAATVFGRFAVNSTVGIGGIFDPARAALKWEKHNEDFGQTLGHYGVNSGPYLVLPLLGSSSARDLVGFITDRFLSPTTWFGVYDVEPEDLFDYMPYVRRVNAYAYKQRDAYQRVMADAFDPYSALQDFYVQYREKEILK